jgi:hypothetical protein
LKLTIQTLFYVTAKENSEVVNHCVRNNKSFTSAPDFGNAPIRQELTVAVMPDAANTGEMGKTRHVPTFFFLYRFSR